MGFAIKIGEGVFVRDVENGELKLCSKLADSKVFDSIDAAAKCISGAGVDVNDCSIININVTQMSEQSGGSYDESSVFGSDKQNRAESYLITFERLAVICEDGYADLILKPGDKLENGYVVAAVRQDSVKIWSPKNFLGDMNWQKAKQVADNYYREWNKDVILPVEAISSGLLSKEEIENLSKSDRTTGFHYWTSTEYSSGYHWIVFSDVSLCNAFDSNSFGCCPGIWVRSRESSKGSSESGNIITFERLHEICEEGSADLILKPGDKLERGYIGVAAKPDAVKIWSQREYVGRMNWSTADAAARKHIYIWSKANSGLPVIALRSELLSKEEVETMSQHDRTTGFSYWTSTEHSSGYYRYVGADGSLYTYDDSYSLGCCPGIWVK